MIAYKPLEADLPRALRLLSNDLCFCRDQVLFQLGQILLEPQLLKKCPWLMCSAGLNNCAVCSFNPSYLLTADSLHLLKILSEKWSSCECLQYEGDNRKTIHNRNNPLLLVSVWIITAFTFHTATKWQNTVFRSVLVAVTHQSRSPRACRLTLMVFEKVTVCQQLQGSLGSQSCFISALSRKLHFRLMSKHTTHLHFFLLINVNEMLINYNANVYSYYKSSLCSV